MSTPNSGKGNGQEKGKGKEKVQGWTDQDGLAMLIAAAKEVEEKPTDGFAALLEAAAIIEGEDKKNLERQKLKYHAPRYAAMPRSKGPTVGDLGFQSAIEHTPSFASSKLNLIYDNAKAQRKAAEEDFPGLLEEKSGGVATEQGADDAEPSSPDSKFWDDLSLRFEKEQRKGQ